MEMMTDFLRSLGVEYQADGRRRWSHDAKAYIVGETLKPGATVKSVAGKFGINANRLSEWRGLAKDGKLVLPAPDPDEHVEFAPVVLCDGGEVVQLALGAGCHLPTGRLPHQKSECRCQFRDDQSCSDKLVTAGARQENEPAAKTAVICLGR